MFTVTDYEKALKDNANETRNVYWRCIGVLADNSSTEGQKAAALRELATAANELGLDAEMIDTDVVLVRERQAAPDLDTLERDTNAEVKQLREESASLEAEAAGADARARELRQQAEKKRGRAAQLRTEVNNAKQADRKLRQQLADRGCPTAMIELAVEEQQRQVDQARGAVEAAERELAEAEKVLERALAGPRPSNDGDPGAHAVRSHVEQCQRVVERARRALREIEARVEVEAAPATPETRAERTQGDAAAAAGLGRRRSGTRN